MKINIYLFKEEVVGYEECFSNTKKTLIPLDTKEENDSIKAYFTQSSNPPKWKKKLSDILEIDDIKNINHSILLLIKEKNRFFAVTFGYANNLINPDKIEPMFGIKVVANSVSSNDINQVVVKKTDRNTMQQITHSTQGANLSEFGINTFTDWVSSLAGKPEDNSDTDSFVGGKSIVIQYKHDLRNLPRLCGKMLDIFQSEKYKQDFAFLDYFVLVSKKTQEYRELETILLNSLESEDSNMVIAYPQIFDEEIYSNFKVGINFDSLVDNDKYCYVSDKISLSEIRSKFKDKVKRVKIRLIDGSGKQVYDEFSIFDFILLEIKRNNKTYVYLSKLWFETESKHEEEINRQFKLIDDITNILNMPDWTKGETEGAYNERVSSTKNWCLMDKKNFREGMNQIEICDLLTPDKYFICVKKMKDSARLSHLFSQGSVSATLYKDNYNGYSHQISDEARQFWNDDRFEQSKMNPCFVYAMQTKKTGDLKDIIFLFSKINLINHARIIKGFGYQVGICKINIL